MKTLLGGKSLFPLFPPYALDVRERIKANTKHKPVSGIFTFIIKYIQICTCL